MLLRLKRPYNEPAAAGVDRQRRSQRYSRRAGSAHASAHLTRQVANPLVDKPLDGQHAVMTYLTDFPSI